MKKKKKLIHSDLIINESHFDESIKRVGSHNKRRLYQKPLYHHYLLLNLD